MKRSRPSAFTLVEALVCLSLIAFLVFLSLPTITSTACPVGRMTQALSNMRQLHLVAEQMALDGTTTGDTNLAWPGDTGGTFAFWSTNAVPSYLGTNDFYKLLSSPGKIVQPGKFPPAMSDTAVLMYAVTDESSTNTVFLTSANFTNTPTGGAPLNAKTKPFGTNAFVVFRKGGHGDILRKSQVGDTNVIGSFAPLLR